MIWTFWMMANASVRWAPDNAGIKEIEAAWWAAYRTVLADCLAISRSDAVIVFYSPTRDRA